MTVPAEPTTTPDAPPEEEKPTEPTVAHFPSPVPPGGGDEPPTLGSPAREPRDGWDPQKNGTIHAWIGGTRYFLRRPRGGEFRRLREYVIELKNRNMELNRTKAQALIDLSEGRKPTVDPDSIDPDREIDEAIMHFWRVVFNGTDDLGGKPFRGLADRLLPEDDDELPAWFLADDFIGETIDVWRSVPRGPGG